MYCTNCGNRIEEGNAFCTTCGKRVSSNADEHPQPDDRSPNPNAQYTGQVASRVNANAPICQPAEVSKAPVVTPSQGNRIRKGAVAGIIAAIVVIVVAAAAIVLTFAIPGGIGSIFEGGKEAAITISSASSSSSSSSSSVSSNASSDSSSMSSSASSSAVEAVQAYILPDSATRLYTEAELSSLSDWELYVARNEIFARHGRGFKNADLVAYFSSQPWYTQQFTPEQFDSMPSPLNDIERANSTLIGSVEDKRGSQYR